MIFRILTTEELNEWALFYEAWSVINRVLTHSIWLKMNPDNYEEYLNDFDEILLEKWEEYAGLN